MAHLLGIKKLVLAINKMDLVGYDRAVFERIRDEYTAFLQQFQLVPQCFIPISGLHGVNIVQGAPELPWYDGPSVLQQVDRFTPREPPVAYAFRLPVQDIYKFTAEGDERRIVTGTIETGRIAVGDAVTFYPSGKQSRVRSIEQFNAPAKTTAEAGEATVELEGALKDLEKAEKMFRDKGVKVESVVGTIVEG